jgi:hypothetical protein
MILGDPRENARDFPEIEVIPIAIISDVFKSGRFRASRKKLIDQPILEKVIWMEHRLAHQIWLKSSFFNESVELRSFALSKGLVSCMSSTICHLDTDIRGDSQGTSPQLVKQLRYE